tara:strand:- start:436 stop:606 length:171 start_codon:yes stop_codon:yes gene_type:complete
VSVVPEDVIIVVFDDADPAVPVTVTPVVYSESPELSEVADNRNVFEAFDESDWSKM